MMLFIQKHGWRNDKNMVSHVQDELMYQINNLDTKYYSIIVDSTLDGRQRGLTGWTADIGPNITNT